MIIVCLILVALIVLGVILYRKDYEELGVLLIVVTGAILIIILLIAWPILYFDNAAQIKVYHVYREVIETSNKEDLRDATITRDIIKFDSYLAERKYYNTLFFCKDFVPDKLVELPYLKFKIK